MNASTICRQNRRSGGGAKFVVVLSTTIWFSSEPSRDGWVGGVEGRCFGTYLLHPICGAAHMHACRHTGIAEGGRAGGPAS
eukprot:362920-Chlamydomonas_euryale.AAC.2